MPRTIAIGDIHGEVAHLERLLHRLPRLTAEDSVVFLGDYVDRGPSSRQVIERVEMFRITFPGKTILLRGNHEDAWLECLEKPNPGFLLPPGNGCGYLYRSFFNGAPELSDFAIAAQLMHPKSWFPAHVKEWMERLVTWYEDEHAIYVHAGLDSDGIKWLHPSEAREKVLLWMREKGFFNHYSGKLVVFGHTPTKVLPDDYVGAIDDVWFQRPDSGDLIAVDTGCGKGGWLSAVELPSRKVYDSRG